MSQAQALLDCVADLIVHCGVTGTVDILQQGLQLQRSASWTEEHHSADSWRILGQSPSPDGGPGDLLCFNNVAARSKAQCGICTADVLQQTKASLRNDTIKVAMPRWFVSERSIYAVQLHGITLQQMKRASHRDRRVTACMCHASR